MRFGNSLKDIWSIQKQIDLAEFPFAFLNILKLIIISKEWISTNGAISA